MVRINLNLNLRNQKEKWVTFDIKNDKENPENVKIFNKIQVKKRLKCKFNGFMSFDARIFE